MIIPNGSHSTLDLNHPTSSPQQLDMDTALPHAIYLRLSGEVWGVLLGVAFGETLGEGLGEG